MIITFEIEGVPQQIKWDSYCFHACHPDRLDRALGYYKQLGGAVSKLIRHHYFQKNDIVNGFEAQIELRDFAEQFDTLVSRVNGVEDVADLNPDVFTTTIIEKEKKVVSQETIDRMKAAKAAAYEKRKSEAEQPKVAPEDDDDDL